MTMTMLRISFVTIVAFSAACILPTHSFNIFPKPSTSSSAPATSAKIQCTIKICHNKDCTKKGGGFELLQTFRDLSTTPSNENSNVAIYLESSGCLSQCGKGPNVLVEKKGQEEKMYFGVADATTASAVLEVAAGEEFPIELLVAATTIEKAEHSTSPLKKEKLLSSVIKTLSKNNDPSLLNSYAHAHARFLRADARLEIQPQNLEGAVEDARTASVVAPMERRVWRVLACAEEAAGNLENAVGALRELGRVDPSFATKAKKEIERLSSLT